jgi:hypothetical protein
MKLQYNGMQKEYGEEFLSMIFLYFLLPIVLAISVQEHDLSFYRYTKISLAVQVVTTKEIAGLRIYTVQYSLK